MDLSYGGERSATAAPTAREKSELERAVPSLAATIASNAPLSVLAGKAAIRAIASRPGAHPAAGTRWRASQRAGRATIAARERTFLEKRAPAFPGR